jgi:hypothetical protein
MQAKKLNIYLIRTERAIKVRESCVTRWNNAWISCLHGSLDFKSEAARDLERYLLKEIRDQGYDVTAQVNWRPSSDGKTQFNGGTNYEGALIFKSATEAVQFLERFFTVVNCD